MLINVCFIETLSTEGIEARRFTETDRGVPSKEFGDPSLAWSKPDDLLQFVFEGPFAKGPACCTSVVHPVNENLLFRMSE